MEKDEEPPQLSLPPHRLQIPKRILTEPSPSIFELLVKSPGIAGDDAADYKMASHFTFNLFTQPSTPVDGDEERYSNSMPPPTPPAPLSPTPARMPPTLTMLPPSYSQSPLFKDSMAVLLASSQEDSPVLAPFPPPPLLPMPTLLSSPLRPLPHELRAPSRSQKQNLLVSPSKASRKWKLAALTPEERSALSTPINSPQSSAPASPIITLTLPVLSSSSRAASPSRPLLYNLRTEAAPSPSRAFSYGISPSKRLASPRSNPGPTTSANASTVTVDNLLSLGLQESYRVAEQLKKAPPSSSKRLAFGSIPPSTPPRESLPSVRMRPDATDTGDGVENILAALQSSGFMSAENDVLKISFGTDREGSVTHRTTTKSTSRVATLQSKKSLSHGAKQTMVRSSTAASYAKSRTAQALLILGYLLQLKLTALAFRGVHCQGSGAAFDLTCYTGVHLGIAICSSMLLLFCTGYPLALALLVQSAKNRTPVDMEVKVAGGLQQWRVQRDLDMLGFLYSDLKRDHAYYRPACLLINFISGLLYITVYDPVVRLCVFALLFYVHLVYITVKKPFRQEREAYAITALLLVSLVSMTVVVGVRAFEGALHTLALADTWHLERTRHADRNATLFGILIFLLLAFFGEHSIPHYSVS
jgi:hypothetical protein